MLGRTRVSLNAVAEQSTMGLIQRVMDAGVQVTEVREWCNAIWLVLCVGRYVNLLLSGREDARHQCGKSSTQRLMCALFESAAGVLSCALRGWWAVRVQCVPSLPMGCNTYCHDAAALLCLLLTQGQPPA